MVTPREGLRLRVRPGHPDFLDLAWQRPLTEWRGDRLTDVVHGLHRHVVRFVAYGHALYALKELPARVARREYGLLRRMAGQDLPVVEVVGVADRAALGSEEPLEDVLITRYLDYSLPYRTLFLHRRPILEGGGPVRGLHDRLLDALAMLLVRLHLRGFYWGDCSLSNTLFRRDAGALAAYVVDLETGEWHPTLTPGQRRGDLEIAQTNITGDLMDVQAELELTGAPDPVETSDGLGERYGLLWHELTTEEHIGPGERYKVDARVRRLNALGFSVDEIELVGTPDTSEGDALRLRTAVTEQGHHRRRLRALVGLGAQENQARSLLNDMANFRTSVERVTGRPLPEPEAAHRWLDEVFEPTVSAVPPDLRAKLEPVELFHEVIEHKWYLSEAAGRDVGVEEAVRSYLREVLPGVPDERAVLPGTATASEGWIGYG